MGFINQFITRGHHIVATKGEIPRGRGATCLPFQVIPGSGRSKTWAAEERYLTRNHGFYHQIISGFRLQFPLNQSNSWSDIVIKGNLEISTPLYGKCGREENQSQWHLHDITTSPHQFHVDLQGSACRSQWKCFVKVTIGTAPTLVFSRIKCLLAALLGTSLVRRVRLCAGTSSDASYTPKLILKKVNEMSQWAMPLRLAIQACSLHWRSSIVICKAVIADRNGIASSRSCLKRFVAPNSIVLCNSVSVDGSGVSVYRFRFWSCNFCWFCA